jgi:molybdopterin-binding protein
MTRNEKISNSTKLRKGKTTAVVALDKHERRYTSSTRDHDSINQAKRTNGRDAVALLKHEHFPPKLADLPVIEEPVAEAA